MGVPDTLINGTPLRILSLQTGISKGYLSRIIRGKRNPKLSTIRIMAKALDMDVDKLIWLIDLKTKEGVPEAMTKSISDGLRRKNAEKARAKRKAAHGRRENLNLDYERQGAFSG